MSSRPAGACPIDLELKAFLAGFVASIGVELVGVTKSFRRGRRHVARRYSDWLFWLLRILLAVVSGAVAWLFYVPGLSSAACLYIGAATPLILTQFAELSDQAAK